MLTTKNELEELERWFCKHKEITYRKGEFIIRPGESPPGVFYIEKGLVKAFDITKYGEENLLIIRRSHEILALTWAITGEDRHIIYQTLAPTTLRQVSRKEFINYLRDHPKLGLPLIDMLTDMYRLHSQRILNLEYRTVRERLISFLLNNAERFGTPQADGTTLIDVPLRHQDIASSINSSRETTSREMAYLVRKGLVKNQQLLINLIDIKKLKSYL